MAQYSTDFSGYASDAQPNDWTARWAAGNISWLVRDVAEATGGKVLEVVNSSAARHLLSWDDIDSDVDRDDAEVAFRWRVTGGVTENLNIEVALRAANALASNATMYRFGTSVSATDGTNITEYLNGSVTRIGEVVATFLENTWYWTRARVNGNQVLVKTWLDSEPEPGPGWQISALDNSISAAGWVGLFTFNAGAVVEVDVFAVGTAGDSAPAPAMASADRSINEGKHLGYQLGFAATLTFPDDGIVLGDSFEGRTPAAIQEDLSEGIVLGDNFSPMITSMAMGSLDEGIRLGDSFEPQITFPFAFQDTVEYDAYLTRILEFDLEL